MKPWKSNSGKLWMLLLSAWLWQRGVVVNVGDFGVFADIGFEQNVILAIPRRHEQTDLYSW